MIQESSQPVEDTPVADDDLTSSVLVTGAMLLGTGDCSIDNGIIHVGKSIQIPTVGGFDQSKNGCMDFTGESLYFLYYIILYRCSSS